MKNFALYIHVYINELIPLIAYIFLDFFRLDFSKFD